MIKCDLGKAIEIKGIMPQIATEFEQIATAIRECFEEELGEESGKLLFEECIKNSKMSEAERQKAVEDAEKEMGPDGAKKVEALLREILGEEE